MVTIAKRTYDRLKREAAAWRNAVGPSDHGVLFDAARDNGGKGIRAEEFVHVLEKLVREDQKMNRL